MNPSSQPSPPKSDTSGQADELREWVDRWNRVGPLMDSLRFAALSRMTQAERVNDLAMILNSMDYRVPNDPSGWLAWQKVRERWSRKT